MFLFVLFFSSFALLTVAGFFAYWGALLSGFLSALVSVGFFVAAARLGRKNDPFDGVKGWLIEQAIEISNPEKPVIGPVVLDVKALDLGVLVMGGPGAGKSITAIAIQKFYRTFRPSNGNAYFEGKGDFDIYRTYVEATGEPDFFFSSDLEHSESINVMSAPVETCIDMFSRVFISETANEFYGSAQKRALRSTIPLLKAFPEPCALPDLWVLLTNEQASRDLLRRGKAEGVDPDILAQAEEYFAKESDDRMNEISGLLNKIHPYVSGPISKKINSYTPSLDIKKAVAEGKRIYFHLPLSETSLAVATMITEMVGVIAKDRQLYELGERKKYPLIYDDWGKFFYGNFGPITARCRSAGMPISFFFQSKGQLDNVEPGGTFTTEITDNIGSIVGMKINGWASSEWLSRMFGEYETLGVAMRDNGGSQTASVQRKPRVLPDDTNSLDSGEAFVKISVTGAGGAIDVRRYKLRFPYPTAEYPAPENWPVVTPAHDESAGIGLWANYRSAEATLAMQKKAVKETLKEESDFVVTDDEDEIIL